MRNAGIFNVVGAFPLAMPFLYRSYFAGIDRLNTALALGGQHIKSPDDGAHALLINTAGLALVLVGLMLIYAAGNLKERMGIPVLNGIVRLVFSVLLVYYLVAEGDRRLWYMRASRIRGGLSGQFRYVPFATVICGAMCSKS